MVNKKKSKIVLPPEVPEDEVEVSDEDLGFVKQNLEYAGLLLKLDTQSITRHVKRVADVKEDDLENEYLKRLRKKLLATNNTVQHEVDPVDALPVKTLDGEVHYRTVVSNGRKPFEKARTEDETVGENEDVGIDNGIVKLTTAEKRAKFKKLRKEAKKQGKEVTDVDEVQQSSQAEVLIMAALMDFIDSHNMVAYLSDPPQEHELFHSLIVGLNTSRIAYAIRENPVICKTLIRTFWENATIDRKQDCIRSEIQKKEIMINEAVIRDVLLFGDEPKDPIKRDKEEVVSILRRMGYEGNYPPTMKKLIHPYWRLLIHIMQLCLIGKKGGSDELSQIHSSALVSLVMGWEYNFSRMLFEDLKSNLTGKKKEIFLMTPRFIQMILDAKYPALEKSVDTLVVKPMQAGVFGFIKQSRKGTRLTYEGRIPLEKFGQFGEIEGIGQAQTVETVQPSAIVTDMHAQQPSEPEPAQEIVSSDDEVTPKQLPEEQVEAIIRQKRVAENPPLTAPSVEDVLAAADVEEEPLIRSRPTQRRRLRDPRLVAIPPTPTLEQPRREQPTSLDGISQHSVKGSSSRVFEESIPVTDAYRIDKGKGKAVLPSVNVDELQERVHVMEQQNASKEALIGDLLDSQLKQSERINSLEAQVGYLTSLFFDLKKQITGTESDRERDGGVSGSGTQEEGMDFEFETEQEGDLNDIFEETPADNQPKDAEATETERVVDSFDEEMNLAEGRKKKKPVTKKKPVSFSPAKLIVDASERHPEWFRSGPLEPERYVINLGRSFHDK